MITNSDNFLYLKRKNFFLIAVLLLLSNSNLFPQSNSSIWVQTASPIYSDLHSIYMFSAKTGVAAGKHILTLKNNKWIEMKKQPPIKITSIFAIDTNSIFAYSTNSYQESELYYWNGENWRKKYHPIVNNIYSMHFINESFGVIGGTGEIVVFKNKNWKFLPPIINTNTISVLINKDSILWVLSGNHKLFKYKNEWKQINTTEPIYNIKMHNDEIYVTGNDFWGKVVSDTIQKITINEDLGKIKSFSVINDQEIFAVGDTGLILHYLNGNWTRNNSNTKENLSSICTIGSESGWIIGDNGTILKYVDKEEKEYKPPLWKGFKVEKLRSYAKLIDDEYGTVAADFNNDGLVDIFTCGLFEKNNLYINNGDNYFNNEYDNYGFTSTGDKLNQKLNLGACAGDIDNDGDIDLYVSSLNGKNNVYKFMHNNSFIDYSAISLGIGNDDDRTNACAFGDIDNDGDLDLFIADEYSSNRMYLNNGVGIFTEITKQCGLNSQYGGMGCTFGDIDNDGDIDLYITNWYGENKLYKNLFKEEGKLYFRDITRKAKVQGEFYTKSNGVVFADIDNDADLDLFVANRKSSNNLYINTGTGIFEDKTKELLGQDSFKTNGVLITDFDGDGYKDIYLSNVGENVFYKNEKGKFRIVSSKYNIGISGYSTGSAYADFDNDGDLDIYLANYVGESSLLLFNQLNDNKYIKLQIEGILNNRSGIGSKIYTYKDGGMDSQSALIDFRQISAGSGYASMNELVQTIPILDNKFVDIKVVFPTGIIKKITHIQAGSSLKISDMGGIKKHLILFKNLLKRRIFDPHELYELIKWIFIFMFILFTFLRGIKRYNWSKLFAFVVSALLLLLYFVQYYNLEYDIFLYSTLLPFVSIIGLVLLMNLFFERNRTKQIALVEQEKIREKLSRDLHDNLASTISSIGIYLTLIRYKITDKDGKINELLQKSESLVSDAAASITDLIWTIKPKPEKFSNLITRINNNFSKLFQEKNIEFNTKCDTKIENLLLKPAIKQNIYLILKEALNNILKHAEAKNVNIDIEKENKNIKIIIKDDGKGFDYKKMKGKGHGLNNMLHRAEDIKADFKITSAIGEGTIYELIFQD